MDPRALRAAFLVLRLFFAQFWLLQFATKVRDSESGVAALRNLGIWSAHVTDWFVKQTPLPAWVVRPYTLSLPTRRALTFSALLLVSLCTGMMLQQKHDVVANNLVFLLATLIALQLEPLNGWALDRLRSRGRAA